MLTRSTSSIDMSVCAVREDTTVRASIGTSRSSASMYLMITRACRRSAAMTMTVARSPGARCGRQSLNVAR